MEIMKKIIFILLAVLILTWPTGIVRNLVDPNLFIFEPEAQAIGALYFMVDSDESPEDDDKQPVAICNCNKNTGKVSYDGGTSWMPCPCADGGGSCGCVNCTKGESAPDAGQTAVEQDWGKTYYITKLTADWCGPCKVWDNKNKPIFEKAGIDIVPINIDMNPGILRAVGGDRIPMFLVCTKIDELYHQEQLGKNTFRYYGGGSGFSYETAISEIKRLDAALHPNRASGGPYYERQGKEETTIGGTKWAEKDVIISHLRDGSHNKVKDWPLEKLSRYELKAIHDDDHAKVLGPLYGL